jgi:ABC-type sugar transport system permease subunit
LGAALPATDAPSSLAHLFKRHQQRLAPVVFLAPALFMFVVFVVNPIVQSIWVSFNDWDGLGPMRWVGFGNYVALFDDRLFYISLKNNLIWLVLYLLGPPAGLWPQIAYGMGYGAAIATLLFLIMDVYIAWFLWRMLRQERRDGRCSRARSGRPGRRPGCSIASACRRRSSSGSCP